MSEKLYVVKYEGPFGFIKPWTAVRDEETYSQQFLTPSIVEGIEKKLFPELLHKKGIHKIRGHRLNYKGLSIQQERTWAKGGLKIKKEKGIYKTNLGVLKRGIMLEPNLYLTFNNKEEQQNASKQSICLCRNEDLLFPQETFELTQTEFDQISGFELMPVRSNKGFKVGYNRFNNDEAMYGDLFITGNPIRND